MIDIHTHLLPGIDDGSESVLESLAHLAVLSAEGVHLLVLTPHLLVPQLAGETLGAELERQRIGFEMLREQLAPVVGLPSIHLGQEVLARNVADAMRVTELAGMGLGGTPAILVEFGFTREYDAAGVIRCLRDNGRVPVVAHAERYVFPGQEPVEAIAEWRAEGAVIQVNAGSLLGFYPHPVEETAWRVVEAGLAHVVASDHHGDARPHSLGQILPRLRQSVGPVAARALLETNPARLLSDEAVVDLRSEHGQHVAVA